MQRFYVDIRKNNGVNYEPESLKVVQPLLDRHLREKGVIFSILEGQTSQEKSSSMARKVIELYENGVGKRK